MNCLGTLIKRFSLYARRRPARLEIDFRRCALEAERAIRPPFRLIFISPLNAEQPAVLNARCSAAKLSLDSIPPGWCALITFVFQPGAVGRDCRGKIAAANFSWGKSPQRLEGDAESDGKRKFRGIGAVLSKIGSVRGSVSRQTCKLLHFDQTPGKDLGANTQE
jgi:hypothetical protein